MPTKTNHPRPKNNSKAWLEEAKELAKLKQWEDALRALDEAIHLSVNNMEAWELKMDILAFHKRWDEVTSTLLELSKLNSKKIIKPILDRIMIIILFIRKYPEVLKLYDRIIELDPHNIKAWYGKGIILNRTGAPLSPEATEAFCKVIELDPEHRRSETWDAEGFISFDIERYFHIDKTSEITSAFDKAKKIEENKKYISPWIERLKKLKKQIYIFGKKNRRSYTPKSWYEKGLFCYVQEKYPEALSSLDNAPKTSPEYERAQILKKIILEKIGLKKIDSSSAL